MSSTSQPTFDEYIAALPAERQPLVRQVWEAVRAAVPAGYTEHIGPKFLEFRAGKDMYVALANQKHYVSLYLMTLYVFPSLGEQLKTAAPKLKSGKSCLNFNRVEELPLSVLGDIIGAVPLAEYVAKVQEVRAAPRGSAAC